ncbi:hypothetical protein ABOC32_05405 [Pseudomonas sp. WOUb67]|uniref:hypothetical protein n=1 Tax=Pseudomonas sp. WOUb67 TaxID=3161136 RepID=UPI003CEF1804
MQPGATRIFCVKGATRLTDISTPLKGAFAVRFILKNRVDAPKRSKKAAFTKNAQAGATCK